MREEMLSSAVYTPATMSNTSGSNSPVSPDMAEGERKKGSRGGKRSVAHLSKAQLARKRANDREAQRNIRQRTKEHIETLERKVKELEEEKREGGLERVLRKNKELEAEVIKLRAQISIQVNEPLPTPPIPTEMSVGYFPDSGSGMWPGRAPIIESIIETGSNTPYSSTVETPLYSVPASLAYDEADTSPSMYSPLDESMWEDSLIPNSQCNSKTSIQSWSPFPMDTSRYNETPLFSLTTTYPTSNWPAAQPRTYSWQITSKIKAPMNTLDHSLMSLIQSQKRLHMSLPSPPNQPPPVNFLFQPPPASKPDSLLGDCMARYSAYLNKCRYMQVPEQICAFTCMYQYYTWLISPTAAAYAALQEWQAPRPSQLLNPHPAWMDLVPWGKFRDKIIHNQDRYGTESFARDFFEGFNLGWSGDLSRAMVFKGDEMYMSPELLAHVKDASNFSMKPAFAEKYPEFCDCCRFDDA